MQIRQNNHILVVLLLYLTYYIMISSIYMSPILDYMFISFKMMLMIMTVLMHEN